MGESIATIGAAVVVFLVPLAVGVRRGQLTAGVVAGTLAAGAVVQFGPLGGLAAAAGLTALLFCLNRRVVRRRDATATLVSRDAESSERSAGRDG